ncbi:MAG: DUF6263 family protein [Gemmataceae bacterium]
MIRSASLLVAIITVTLGGVLAFGQSAPAGKKYALLVGINDYQHERLPTLRYAERDVEELAKVLEPAGYAVTLLTGSQPAIGKRATKTNIDEQVKGILRQSAKGDVVVLAFAGHGLQFDNQPDAYFCPLDARPFSTATDTLVSLSSIYQNFDQSFAGMKVLLVDACRNDPDRQRGTRSGIDADHAPRPPAGVAALFSCRAGERAFEADQLKHGIFFHHVIEALKGEAAEKTGEVTFASLASLVSRRVSRDVPLLIKEGAAQSPNLKADYSTEPVLLRVERAGEVRSTQPSEQTPPPTAVMNSQQVADLRFKFEVGTKLYQRDTVITKQKMKAMQADVEKEHELTTSICWEPEMISNGRIVIVARFEGLKLRRLEDGKWTTSDSSKPSVDSEMDARFKALLDSKFTFTFDQDLHVTNLEGYSEFLERWNQSKFPPGPSAKNSTSERVIKNLARNFEHMPTGPVRKGDSWIRNDELDLASFGCFTNTSHYKLDGFQGNYAIIGVQIQQTYKPPKLTADDLGFEIVSADLKGKGIDGAVQVDLSNGSRRSLSSKTKFEGKLSLKISGTTTDVALEQLQESTTVFSDRPQIPH